MNTVLCPHCGKHLEVDKALEGQIEARVLAAERQKHEAELEQLKRDQANLLADEKVKAAELAKQTLEGEKELLTQKAAADLELAQRRLEQEMSVRSKKAELEQQGAIEQLKADAEGERVAAKELRQQLSELMQNLREEKRARANAELEAQKKFAEEEIKLREQIQKSADEKQRYDLAAKNKTIEDLQKALDAAQRKAAQGSQQLQGEIMELDLEEALASAFRDDEIAPVAKGTRGGDIQQTVKSPRGTPCGVILWEIKRTKNWTDGWIPKLKEDLRNARANVPVIVSEVMPKSINEDLGQIDGVWVCKPQLTIIVASLLRKGLLDVGLQKALAEDRGSKAETLYSFITSHEFVQQVESMVETYQEMNIQIQKERVAYEKLWAQREKQAQKLYLSTANIVGSMQGHIGRAMPSVKGLDLLEGGEDL